MRSDNNLEFKSIASLIRMNVNKVLANKMLINGPIKFVGKRKLCLNSMGVVVLSFGSGLPKAAYG